MEAVKIRLDRIKFTIPEIKSIFSFGDRFKYGFTTLEVTGVGWIFFSCVGG